MRFSNCRLVMLPHFSEGLITKWIQLCLINFFLDFSQCLEAKMLNNFFTQCQFNCYSYTQDTTLRIRGCSASSKFTLTVQPPSPKSDSYRSNWSDPNTSSSFDVTNQLARFVYCSVTVAQYCCQMNINHISPEAITRHVWCQRWPSWSSTSAKWRSASCICVYKFWRSEMCVTRKPCRAICQSGCGSRLCCFASREQESFQYSPHGVVDWELFLC